MSKKVIASQHGSLTVNIENIDKIIEIKNLEIQCLLYVIRTTISDSEQKKANYFLKLKRKTLKSLKTERNQYKKQIYTA